VLIIGETGAGSNSLQGGSQPKQAQKKIPLVKVKRVELRRHSSWVGGERAFWPWQALLNHACPDRRMA